MPTTIGGADGTDVICTARDSQATAGTVSFTLWRLTQRPEDITGQAAFVSLYNFSLATHIRFRFLQPVSRGQAAYAVSALQVLARLNCNGHGTAQPGQRTCSCVHNTVGPDCGQCAPLANGVPFSRWTTVTPATCVQCACNNHATQCEYDAVLEGGICTDCSHNTTGGQCERCRAGFFRPSGVTDLSAPDVCTECDCDPTGVNVAGCVRDVFTAGAGQAPGDCLCKSRVGGSRCDNCLAGFTNLDASNPDGCDLCSSCAIAGSAPTNVCGLGVCDCKLHVRGALCDTCENGFHNLSIANPLGCEQCTCDPVGSQNNNCEPSSGQCTCRQGYTGSDCSQCADGYTLEPTTARPDGECVPCGCNPIGVLNASCSLTGACHCMAAYSGNKCDRCASGYYNTSSMCAPCGCSSAGTQGNPTTCNPNTGQCLCKTFVEGRTCDTCSPGYSVLQASNADGCSGSPSGFAQPTTTIVGSENSPAVMLQWVAPSVSAGPVVR